MNDKNLTPMMEQYHAQKSQHPNELLSELQVESWIIELVQSGLHDVTVNGTAARNLAR